MSSVITYTKKSEKISVKAQTYAAVVSIVLAVVLPQLIHTIGIISGLGTALGEVFLPMHLPVIFCGLIAGPFAGAAAGFASPIISFMLTGMPKAVMLPFMVIELLSYGLFAGLLRNVKLNGFIKVLAVQIGGRAVRAAAIAAAVYIMGVSGIAVSVIWSSVVKGLFGIILQWSLIPLAVYFAENYKKNEK